MDKIYKIRNKANNDFQCCLYNIYNKTTGIAVAVGPFHWVIKLLNMLSLFPILATLVNSSKSEVLKI